MSEALARVTLGVLVELELTDGDVDPDQVLSWMADLGAAIGDLDSGERAVLADVAGRLASEAAERGDEERADAFARIAEAEGSSGEA